MNVSEPTPLPRLEPTLWGVLAEFHNPQQLMEAAAKVRAAGYTKFDCHSPFPVHGMERSMGIPMTSLPMFVFFGGIGGLLLALAMQFWMNGIDYAWIISGKPLFSVPANIPITFELTVLLAAFTCFFGVMIANRAAEFYHPILSSERFRRATLDGFFISIEATDPKYDAVETNDLLRAAGATHLEGLMAESTELNKMPRAFIGPIATLIALSFVPLGIAANARVNTTEKPRIHIIPDMDNQQRYRAQAESKLFPDGRSTRLPVEGTVPRGYNAGDPVFYTGKNGDQFATRFPKAVAAAFGESAQAEKLMARGQERFDIYCAPCHGLAGYGDGVVAQRAEALAEGTWVPPTSLHEARVRAYPHGQLFDIITNGIRNMRPYAAQITEDDRWAIVLYVRALQRSQYAAAGEVPQNLRQALD